MNPRFYTFLKSCLAVAVLTFSTLSAFAQVTVAGGTAAAGSYATLNAAMTAINAGTATGAITISFTAGHIETAPPTGIHIGSATLNPTLSATNTLTITGTGATINAGVGVSLTNQNVEQDGIIKLVGADWVTIDGLTLVDPNVSTTASAVSADYGIALYKAGPTDGCQNNTIQNCTITLNRNNNTAGGGARAQGSIGVLIINSLSSAPTATVTPTAASGSHSFNKVYGNTIRNVNYGVLISGFPAATPATATPDPLTFLGDLGNDVGGNSTTTGNIIQNFGSAPATGQETAGIRYLHQWSSNASYNTINNVGPGGANTISVIRGIWTNTSTGLNGSISINNNNISISSAATGFINVTGIENGIGTRNALAITNSIRILNNTVQLTTLASNTGTITGIFNNFTTADTTLINGNSVSANLAGTGTFTGINTSASTSTVFYNRITQVNNNTVSNIIRTSAFGGTTGITVSASANFTVSGNTVSNFLSQNVSATNSVSMTGINLSNFFTSLVPSVDNVTNNVVNNLRINGTSTSTFHFVSGITLSGNTTNTTRVCSGNTVSNLNILIGDGTMYGINNGSALSATVSNNKIFNLTNLKSSVNGTSVFAGIFTTNTGANTFIRNNIVGGMRAPSINTTNAQSFCGMLLSTTSTLGAHFFDNNTVLLNTTTSAPSAAFNASALFTTTTSNVTVRNNILVNLCATGTTGFIAAYRRADTNMATYQTASNNNLYYVSAAPTARRHMFMNGTNNFNTLSGLKTFMVTRDQNSISEAPNFVSTVGSNAAFLHINTTISTFIESGGTPISGLVTDFDGDIRNFTTPDIGADEFNGIPPAACAGVPSAGVSSSDMAEICFAQSTPQFNNNAINALTGISYYWMVGSSATGPFAPATGGTGSATQSHVIPNTYAVGQYFFVMVAKCNNTQDSAVSNAVSLLVKQVPTASITTNAPVCKGTTLSLSGLTDVGTTFNWSGPGAFTSTNQNISFANAGYSQGGGFTFTSTNNGCTSTPANITALVSYAPDAPTVLPVTPTPLCPGSGSGIQLSVNPVVPQASYVSGTGTLNSGTTGYPTPYGSFYGSSRTQYLILASELLAANVVPGSALNNITFNIAAGQLGYVHQNYTIALGTTTATALTQSAWQNANVQVFGPVTYTTVAGANTHTFSTPFVWDGSSNIVVQTCHMNGVPGSTSTSFTSNGAALYTSTSFNSAVWRRTDGFDNCFYATVPNDFSSGISTNRANMTFGITAPTVSYSWSGPAGTLNVTNGSSVVATPLATSTYTVQATTNVGCTVTSTREVVVLPPVTASTSSTNVTCAGFTNGTATVSAGGGNGAFTYLWSNGATTASISNLSNTTYTVTVTSGGCTTSAEVVVNANPSVGVTATVLTNVACFGGNTGSVLLVGNGGQLPYTGTGTISGLTAGPKNLTITDGAGCQATASFTITQPDALTTAPISSPVLCNGGATGSIAANIAGGVTPYTISWSNGQTGPSATGLTAGTYNVAVTDNNGCTTGTAVLVNEPTLLQASVFSGTDVLCNGAATGVSSILATGGTPAYTYSWSNGATGATATGLVAGSYVVTVTDANGCMTNVSDVITQPTALVLTATVSAPTCATGAYLGTENGSVKVNASGGVEPYVGNIIYNGLIAGTYSYTVTDANGCTATISATVPQGNANTTYYQDADVDAFGNANVTILSCTGVPTGYVANATDCDDNSNTTYPNALETANTIDDDCNGTIDDICLTPGGFTVTNITANTARINWVASINLIKYIVQYRALGATTWQQVATGVSSPSVPSPNFVNIGGLLPGTVYQYRVRTQCYSGFTNWSGINTFTTTGGVLANCAPPTLNGASSIGSTTATLGWILNGGNYYQVRYRPAGTTSYTTEATAPGSGANTVGLIGLSPNTTYQFSIRTQCTLASGPAFSAWSGNATFTTTSAGALMVNEENQPMVVEAKGIRLFPNPTSNVLYVQQLPTDATSVSIMDGRGAELLKVDTEVANNGIELIDMADGVYYIVVRTQAGDRIAVPFVKTSE